MIAWTALHPARLFEHDRTATERNRSANERYAGNRTCPRGQVLTWPNFLFLGVFIFTCYHRIRSDATPLPDYILVIETIGICVWLLPFALFYNIDGRRITKTVYIAANIGFLLIFLAWAAWK